MSFQWLIQMRDYYHWLGSVSLQPGSCQCRRDLAHRRPTLCPCTRSLTLTCWPKVFSTYIKSPVGVVALVGASRSSTADQLHVLISAFKLLSELQSAYRAYHSTGTAVLNVLGNDMCDVLSARRDVSTDADLLASTPMTVHTLFVICE